MVITGRGTGGLGTGGLLGCCMTSTYSLPFRSGSFARILNKYGFTFVRGQLVTLGRARQYLGRVKDVYVSGFCCEHGVSSGLVGSMCGTVGFEPGPL